MEDKSTLRVVLAGMPIFGKLIDKKAVQFQLLELNRLLLFHKDQ